MDGAVKTNVTTNYFLITVLKSKICMPVSGKTIGAHCPVFSHFTVVELVSLRPFPCTHHTTKENLKARKRPYPK